MAKEVKQELKNPAHWPPIPAAYDGSLKVINIDLLNRTISAEQLQTLEELKGLATITFPLTEDEAYAMADYFAAREDWEVFVARGIRDRTTGLVRKMDMGSLKLPYVVKPQQGPDGDELIPLYPFTYLIFRKGKGGKDPERNWKYARFQDISHQEQTWYGTIFSANMNHYLPKKYRTGDGIGWHQDNGKMFKFRDLHPDVGFEDLVLYPRASLPRWLQLYNPATHTTFNILPPTGTLITLTGEGNRRLWHGVPKDPRANIGLRFSIVARHLLTLYNWTTRKVYPAVAKKKTQKPKKGKAKKQAEESKEKPEPVSMADEEEKPKKQKKRKAVKAEDDEDDEIVVVKKKGKRAGDDDDY